MEYSPMLVVMLWALTPSDCWPTGGGGTGEQARVVEMPQPVMSVHPEGGYFTFNHGRPFLAERDPLTGAIDSNIKTTPVTSEDYLYEEYEESGETIDRKDSTKIYTRNDITSPSKDSDLHKFLNLPVHYSSSGKFPLISSSYANTKVQGHGPLSNHKLYTPSTSTTTTVSPSYYPLKTTAASTTTAKITTTKATTTSTTTTTTTTTTTKPPTSQRTTSTTTRIITTPSTTKAPQPPPTSTTTRITSTTTSTRPPVPPLQNYEYEYDYDYDKSDGEGTEKTSNDYEFLGASSEVTKLHEKPSTRNPIKPSSTTRPTPSSIEDHPHSTITVSTNTNKATPTVEVNKHASKPEMKPTIVPAKNEKEQLNTSKLPSTSGSTTVYHEDVVDLKPPKPDLSVELRPPQVQPTRPYSSVVPTKPQSFGHTGYVRYPDSPIIVEDKKPLNIYSHQNISKMKPEITPTASHQSNLNNRPQEEKETTNSQPRPLVSQPTQNVPIHKPINTVLTLSIQNHSSMEVSDNRKPSFQNKSNLTNNIETPQALPSYDKPRPQIFSISEHNLPQENPLDKHKNSMEISKIPEGTPMYDNTRPQIATEINRHEDLLDYKKNQGILLKPEYRPQGLPLPEHSKLQGVLPSSHNRPQDHRPHMPIQGHTNPQNPTYQNTKPQEASTTETKRIQRPQVSTPDNSRLQVNLKPDNRPPSGHLSHNNKPFVYYPTPEHTRPYQVTEHNHTPNNFRIRINERPPGSDIPPGMDHVRPHAVSLPQVIQHEQKKPVNGVDMRPHHTMTESDVRPGDNQRIEGSTKPVIFSKPQSGKRPDYNTVQFGQPSKVENHFISVSPGHDNPSYSLQTSFSIGVPPPEQKQTSSVSHGVGQVLFPDEESEKRPPQPVWPHQRPPQIPQPDSHPSIQVEKYPRPPWESHLKPPQMYHKKEHYPPIKRKPLPNILPQFRPNAKVGHAEPHIYLKPREPYDTLQPPPLPRPQFLRLEPDIEETKPLVHRRNGQSSTRVTTLQMMQGPPASKRAALRIDDTNEKNEPVFVVYPSNGNNAPPPPPPSDGVVVGTRGPQRPLPPDNLDVDDDLDSFPLDNNKNFQARVDTPVLKSKSPTPKPVVKNDFPYTLIKPNPEERVTPGNVVTKEYTAFSPTLPSTEKDHDTEINIIPYLQDYMPFATKKPPHKEAWLLGTDIKHLTASIGPKPTEVTQTLHKNDNHRVVVSEGPQPQDFQAPFHASLTAPSQGWSVVQKKPNKEKNNEEMTTTKDLNEVQTTEEPKFDIQNFKPQLFGGFKPIVPPNENENKENMRV